MTRDQDACAEGFAIDWLNDWNAKARDYFNGDIVADWNNNVDITEEHAEESKVFLQTFERLKTINFSKKKRRLNSGFNRRLRRLSPFSAQLSMSA